MQNVSSNEKKLTFMSIDTAKLNFEDEWSIFIEASDYEFINDRLLNDAGGAIQWNQVEFVEILLISILLGFITGLVLALTGAGGTVIAIPLLMFGLHLVIAEAAPIALLAICLSSAAGAMYAHKQGKDRYRAAGFLAMTGK